MKEKISATKILYLAKISFKVDGEINNYTDKKMLREFGIIKQAFQ